MARRIDYCAAARRGAAAVSNKVNRTYAGIDWNDCNARNARSDMAAVKRMLVRADAAAERCPTASVLNKVSAATEAAASLYADIRSDCLGSRRRSRV